MPEVLAGQNFTNTYILTSNIFNGSESHNYDFRMWLNADSEPIWTDETIAGQTFKVKLSIIGVIKGTKETLKTEILAQGGGAAAIEAKGSPNFAVMATSADTGLYSAEDEYGKSYYYRGEKDLLNNNLIFANMQWKIIRINGDGSIRIIYNGECPGNSCSINSTGTATQWGALTDWSRYGDAKFVGYMYGTPLPSTCREGTGCATDNQIDSYPKVLADGFYSNAILNQGSAITSMIVDNIFCNDRQLEPSNYAFSARYGANPTLRCGAKNARFTVNDTTKGNGALTYPAGLITADELLMAGYVAMQSCATNYLYTNQEYWSLTPSNFHANEYGYAYVWIVHPTMGLMSIGGTYMEPKGVRPVINISSEITEFTGNGSAANPYKVLS